MDSQVINKIDLILNDLINEKEPGVVISISKCNKNIYTKSIGMADLERNVSLHNESVMDVASISKQFVAVCIYILIDQEKLSLDDNIITYLDDIPEYMRQITIENLLHHTSGIKDYMDLFKPAKMREENRYENGQILNLIYNQASLNFNPGSKFEYSNSGYFLLAEIIQKIAGKSLAEFAHHNIFEKLKMDNTLFYDNCNKIIPNRVLSYSKKENGFENFPYIFDTVGDTGLLTTVNDLTKWGRIVLNKSHDFEFIIKNLLNEGKLNNGNTVGYAGGLFLYEYQDLKVICHGGSAAGYRSDLLLVPEKDLVITFMSNFDQMKFISWEILDLFIN